MLPSEHLEALHKKLHQAFSPLRLEIHDDSADHAGHGASGAHMRIIVVAEAFRDLTPLARHRKVNALLQEELASGRIHALQISARAPGENS